MILNVVIPPKFEMRLCGSDLTIIGPNGTRKYSDDKFLRMELIGGPDQNNYIVCIPHVARWASCKWDSGSKMDQAAINQCAFFEANHIERLIEEIK